MVPRVLELCPSLSLEILINDFRFVIIFASISALAIRFDMLAKKINISQRRKGTAKNANRKPNFSWCGSLRPFFFRCFLACFAPLRDDLFPPPSRGKVLGCVKYCQRPVVGYFEIFISDLVVGSCYRPHSISCAHWNPVVLPCTRAQPYQLRIGCLEMDSGGS